MAFFHDKMNWATSWENLFMPYANNKGADQPAHPRSLNSAFVIRYWDSIKPLASLCSWAGRFESYLVANPEDRFSCDAAQLFGSIPVVIESVYYEPRHKKTCLRGFRPGKTQTGPEDRFSHDAAQLFGSIPVVIESVYYEPRHEKTCLQGFRPGNTQTGLRSHRG